MLHDDDAPVGRVLTRREALVLLGGAGAGGLLWVSGCSRGQAAGGTAGGAASAASVGCVAKPEMTEGPYFVDEGLTRVGHSGRHEDRGGPGRGALHARVQGLPTRRRTPAPRSRAPWWTCGTATHSVCTRTCGTLSSIPGARTGSGATWLTDAAGAATFTTVFPGWYPGPRGPHSLQDPLVRGRGRGVRLHLAALLRRELSHVHLRGA